MRGPGFGRLARAGLAGAMMCAVTVAGGPRAWACADPVSYLVVCCPKPCMVYDPLTYAQSAVQSAEEALKIAEMNAELASWANQVKAVGNVIGTFASIVAQVNGLKAGLLSVGQPTFGTIDISQVKSMLAAKNAVSNLYFNPFPNGGLSLNQLYGQRMAATQGAMTDLEAVAEHARTILATSATGIQALSAATKATTDLEGDLAVGNLIRLALLQSLQTSNTVMAGIATAQGSGSALALGPDSTYSPQAYASSASTPYSTAPAVQAVATATGASVATASAVTSAVLAMETAVDLHNAVATAIGLGQGYADAASVVQAAGDAASLAQNALSGLMTALTPLYADPGAAASAMMADFAAGVTTDYTDTADRTSEQTANDGAILAGVMAGGGSYGTLRCPPGSTGTDASGNPAACSDLIAAAVTASLYAAGDAAAQAAWLSQAGAEATAAEGQNVASATGLSQATGVELTNAAATSVLASDLAAAAKLAAGATASGTLTDAQAAQLAAAGKTLSAVAADDSFATFIPYDPTMATAATPSGISASDGG